MESEEDEEDFDPYFHSNSIIAAKGVGLKTAHEGIERVLRKHGYFAFLSQEGYEHLSKEQDDRGQEDLEFVWYSVVEADSWCYLKMEWGEGRECARELSELWKTLLCDAKQVESTWWLTVYASGKQIFEHSSDVEVGLEVSTLLRVLGTEKEYLRLAHPGPLSEAFGVDIDRISPYLYYFTRPELEAFSVLSDGLGHSFTAPLFEDDLRTPGQGWHVADLVRRLGADRIDDVLRGRAEMPPVKYAVRKKEAEPDPWDREEPPPVPEEHVAKAREGLHSRDPQRQLACADFLFLSDDQEEVPVLRGLAQRRDVIGAHALSLFVIRELRDVLWDLFRQPEGLLPLERARVLRMLARSPDPTFLSVVENCLSNASLLVRLEALETFARLGGSQDHASLVRMVESKNPFERLTATAVRSFLTGNDEDIPSDSDLQVAPQFIDETIPLRYRSLNFRHHQRHLALRVYSLEFLGSVRTSPHPAYQAMRADTGVIPYLGDIIKEVRALGLDVIDAPGVTGDVLVYPPIAGGEELPRSFSYLKTLEEGIRAAEGGLAITARGARVEFRGTSYHQM